MKRVRVPVCKVGGAPSHPDPMSDSKGGERGASSPATAGDSLTYPAPVAMEAPPGVVGKWAYAAGSLLVPAVTVFTDRAEVTRAIRLDVTENGQHDIVVQGLGALVAPDSVRWGQCRVSRVIDRATACPRLRARPLLCGLQCTHFAGM